MTTIVDFPEDVLPLEGTGGSCEPVSVVDVHGSSRTGSMQAVLRGPGELWRQTFTIRTSGAKEDAVYAALMKLRGRANTLRCPDLFARSEELDGDGNEIATGSDDLFSDGSLWADGQGWAADPANLVVTMGAAGSKGDTTVTLSTNQTDPDVIPVKSRLQFGDKLHAVLSYDSATGATEIHPPLREAISNGATVVAKNAKGLWRLEASEQVVGDYTARGVTTRQITLVEDL